MYQKRIFLSKAPTNTKKYPGPRPFRGEMSGFRPPPMPRACDESPLVSLESTPRIGCMFPLVSFKFGLEGLPPYPVWAAHFLWSVSSPKAPPPPAVGHASALVSSGLGWKVLLHTRAHLHIRDEPKITTYPKPPKYQARHAAARNNVPSRRRKGPGPPASCRKFGFRLSTPKVPVPKLTGCSTHAPWHSRRIPERPTNGGHWAYGQNTLYHSGCGHKLPWFR